LGAVTSSDPPELLRDGRYAIVRALGEGAQGATFEAVDKRDGRLVAIKRFSVKGAKSWKDVELAEREARVLATLDHPALPRHVEHFEENGCLYLVMERIEGESLAALHQRGARLAQDDVLAFLEQASEVLDYLHTRSPPVIHRDIKPGNVIRRPDGTFAFVDFGSVRASLKPEGGSTVVGTFGYMAPEQFQGRALPASDVYAVGATALSLLTGREPEDLPHRGLSIDVGAALGGSAEPGLSALFARLLEPDPDQRASRIEPLFDAFERGELGGSRRNRPRAERHERHRARREQRSERRRERRNARRRGPADDLLRSPFFLSAMLLFLWVARILIWALWEVALPTAFVILSVVLGSPLRRAARSASGVGRRGRNQVRETARRLRERSEQAAAERYLKRTSEAPSERFRVEGSEPEPRVRLDQEEAEEPEERSEPERARAAR
jgi:serine/threonine protein kinase